MENKDKQRVLNLLSDEARRFGTDADWFDSMHSSSLSELYRFGHKTICDFIEVSREECDTLDEISEMLDEMRYDYFNRYKYLQGEHFDHLAELTMFGYLSLGDVAIVIERNK